jgi:hypothetical protein
MEQQIAKETKQEKKKRHQLKFIEEEKRKYQEQKQADLREIQRSRQMLGHW